MVAFRYCRDNELHIQIETLDFQLPLVERSPHLWRSFTSNQSQSIRNNFLRGFFLNRLDLFGNFLTTQLAVQVGDVGIGFLCKVTFKTGIHFLMKS